MMNPIAGAFLAASLSPLEVGHTLRDGPVKADSMTYYDGAQDVATRRRCGCIRIRMPKGAAYVPCPKHAARYQRRFDQTEQQDAAEVTG